MSDNTKIHVNICEFGLLCQMHTEVIVYNFYAKITCSSVRLCPPMLICYPVFVYFHPLTSNRHHLSYDDCLENKGRLQDRSCSIGSYHCIQCYAHIYEQLLQVKQICLCLTGFTSLCLDAYVYLCSLVFHCMHVVLL